ncbi:helix-turn-helix domain-containing protein [Flavobacterium eburneipallidum]|uniref:helix-turn-helix domain-containing protein n=1 Tax=Flavobacterium eburneipallidum TaxID=3003263 RepID=UPI0022AC7B05|nr:AraC family transcriptional regulator [Flavobacterium eburneipallidum]
MRVFIKFDFNTVCKKILSEKLEEFQIKHRILGFGEVDFLEIVPKDKLRLFTESLRPYGIEIVENQKTVMIQKIKDAIVDMVFNDETSLNVKSSVYLAEKLDRTYGYLSNLFSEVTYTSIENFIILQKIEYTKQLIINNQLSLTEIAFKLNYSSVAHLSSQFKNTTGITPSAFQRIIKRRREITN